jgi:hypothetical protein
MNLFHAFQLYFPRLHFNIILPSTVMSFKFSHAFTISSRSFERIFYLPYAKYILRAPHSPWFDCPLCLLVFFKWFLRPTLRYKLLVFIDLCFFFFLFGLLLLALQFFSSSSFVSCICTFYNITAHVVIFLNEYFSRIYSASLSFSRYLRQCLKLGTSVHILVHLGS